MAQASNAMASASVSHAALRHSLEVQGRGDTMRRCAPSYRIRSYGDATYESGPHRIDECGRIFADAQGVTIAAIDWRATPAMLIQAAQLQLEAEQASDRHA